jgi:oligoendopeptidase F
VESRKNKAPGAYSLGYAVTRQPFIFMSTSGTHEDVQTMLHEGGHAMHEFLRQELEYFHDRAENYLPFEFAEVASMAMEMIAAPFTTKEHGGFYTDQEYARSTITQLEGMLTFWPYMALVDHFQHWIYENESISWDGELCEKKWSELWDRYMPSIDYSGLETEKSTYWQRQGHIFTSPLYYIEYGMAQLGAAQVWANTLVDQKSAIDNYTKALKLGSRVGLPELFETAGAEFKFDTATLKRSIDLIEKKLQELEDKL